MYQPQLQPSITDHFRHSLSRSHSELSLMLTELYFVLQPSVQIFCYRRSDHSVYEFGINQTAVWKPNSSMVAVSVSMSSGHNLEIIHNRRKFDNATNFEGSQMCCFILNFSTYFYPQVIIFEVLVFHIAMLYSL